MKRAKRIADDDGPWAWRFQLAAEILPLALILGSIGGTIALVLRVQSRAIPPKTVQTPVVVVPVREVVTPPLVPPATPPPVLAVEPPEDPTPKELARLAGLRDGEVAEVGRLAREAEALERARKRTMAEAETLARAERDARRRASVLDGHLATLETELDNLAFHREALTRERDQAKAALGREQVRAASGYSVQPYKGPNGTWRRPIAIECVNGTVKIQPDGPEISLLELSPLQGPRSNPLVAAVARETARVQGPTPDGAPSVPYILFVIRPDGIRPYYEALMRLEPLGLAFGYELVDQDWVIDYPPPGDFPGMDRTSPAPPRWPVDRPLAGGRGSNSGALGGESPAGSSLGATDSAGRPLLFSGESADGLDFEPTPPLERSVPGQDRGAGGGEGLAKGSDRALAPFAPAGTRHPTRGGGRGGGEFLGTEHSNASRGTGPEDGDHLPPGLGSGSEPGRMASGRPGAEGASGAKFSPGGGTRSGRLAPSNVGRNAGGSGIADGGTTATGRAIAPGNAAGGLAAKGGKTRVDGSSAGAGPGSGSGPNLGKGTGRESASHRAEKALELVVSCGPKGVVIHPGAYRLSTMTLKAREANLAKALQTIVAARQLSQPDTIWNPQVRFQVEPGGQKTYWTARGQVLMEGLPWPTTVRLADAIPRTFGQELR